MPTVSGAEWLNALWPELRLPVGVRCAWEELHPVLALEDVAGGKVCALAMRAHTP
jgi:hypothetical protein